MERRWLRWRFCAEQEYARHAGHLDIARELVIRLRGGPAVARVERC
jgi:hypothetical protein